MDITVLKLLAGAGDFATVFFAWGIWKLDRRMLILEQRIGNKK